VAKIERSIDCISSQLTDRKGFVPNLKIVADIANLLLVQYNLQYDPIQYNTIQHNPIQHSLLKIGKHWVPNFIKQYSTLKSKLSYCLDYKYILYNNSVLINK
jgi:hypothetical protein